MHQDKIMCLYPTLIKNPKYTATKKNGGVIPPILDKRVMYVPIGCGKCMECKQKKQQEWVVRLTEDVKYNVGGKFITLTFSNENYSKLAEEFKELKGYDLDNAVATLAVRRFTERWRKKYKKTIRHWIVTELGSGKTEHLHMHGILWGDAEEIERIWKYGSVWKGKEYRNKVQNYVNGKTIGYITKYMIKVDEKHKEYKPIILCSNGIGKGYMSSINTLNNVYKEEKTVDSYVCDNGSKKNLPVYYRNHLYSDEEKEKLWCYKLDKEERYVLKQKISVKNGYREYYEVLQIARQQNAKLGFGSRENWDRREYENKIREIKQEMRGVKKRRESNKEIMKINSVMNENKKCVDKMVKYSVKYVSGVRIVSEKPSATPSGGGNSKDIGT